MLEKLLISKARIKLITYFINNEDAELHVRGLTRELQEEINSIRRELKNLEELGLLKSTAKGNRLYYRLNKHHLFYPELKQLVLKNREDIQYMHKKLTSIKKIRVAFATQNYLTGKYTSDYDIDLFIAGNVSIPRLQKQVQMIEKYLERELRVTVLTESDFEFHRRKQSFFLNNVLKKYKIFLIGNEQDLFSTTQNEEV